MRVQGGQVVFSATSANLCLMGQFVEQADKCLLVELYISFEMSFVIEMKYFMNECTLDAFYFFVELVVELSWWFAIRHISLSHDAFKFL